MKIKTGDTIKFRSPTAYYTGKLTRKVKEVHPNHVNVRAHGFGDFHVAKGEIIEVNGIGWRGYNKKDPNKHLRRALKARFGVE